MVLLYGDIGDRIRKEILGNERAVYGKRVIEGLADQLTPDNPLTHDKVSTA